MKKSNMKSARFEGDPNLKQTLNRIMTGEPFNQDATYRTITPYMGQNEQLDVKKEVGKIHMYDSLLLGNKGNVAPHK